MGRYSNISLRRYRKILKHFGLAKIRTDGGHEMWYKEGMLRNVVLQSHISPVPEFIVLNNIDTMGITKKELDEALEIF
ncbi:MAG: type II toxin-antitoxin system HicA family toxin [Bacteroidales bacterium]|nr:type II toxin-antitoxin system HicA family toxin [Bacteroidales bacterium]